ncbi:MAG: carbohydrate ABC transporter permease [Planctomycetota bacterium]
MSRRQRILAFAALAILAFCYVLPILMMLVGSLKPDGRVLADSASWLALVPIDASFQNYADIIARDDLVRYYFNSVVITGSIVALGLVVNSMCGYALARLHWRGRQTVLLAVLALLVIPFEAIVVPLFSLMSAIGWTDSYRVQIVPFIANPLSVYLFYTFFNGLPKELEESARIDGAGPWTIYWRIVAPLAGPAFAAVAILTFLLQWGSYLWPLMVTIGPDYRPLPVAIGNATAEQPVQWGDIMAFGTLMALPVMLVFILFQRAFVRGIAFAGLKG